MDGIHPHFTVRTSFCFLLLTLLRASTADICDATSPITFAENNAVGDVVQTITVQTGVTLAFTPPPANPNNPFLLSGNQLIAARVLDYETLRSHVVQITCTETATNLELGLNIVIIVNNVNDNPPVFDENTYHINVNEMSPFGTTVGRFTAMDLDDDVIFYTLMPQSSGFALRSPTIPDLLVDMPLDYEMVKNVQLILYAQDTPLALANSRASFTATTTIQVTIVDVDNRPPWFQPCSKHEIGGVVLCPSDGYTGRVTLNEQETGVLPLKPGPLYAIDGDSAINEAITYSFVSGNDGGLFEINRNTGNITMLKPADVLGTITLTVLAAQSINSFQLATTTVTLEVQVKSLHPPQFQRPQYEGVITAVGVMAMDPTNKNEPLQILATDDDFAATGGLNPDIVYYVNGSSDFSIVGGYLFMTTDLPEATYSLQVVATDTSNEESDTAQLSVEVTSGLTTTSLPLSTTDSMTTSIGESTTNSKTTEGIVSTTNPATSTFSSLSTTIPGTTSESTISTTNPITSGSSISTTFPTMTSEGSASTTNPTMTSEGSASTTNPTVTSEGSISTASTTPPHTVVVPSGGFGVVDMVALGVTLGVLLLICLLVILVLALRLRRGDADWRKIFDANTFQSSLGQSGPKEGIQYTNEAFQNDDDGGSTGSGGPMVGSTMAREVAGDFSLSEASVRLHTLLRDDTSLVGSDKDDNEKEVKPILTKERRMDDGYKSVWFREDIDPDAKEEVVIIPASRQDDSEEEEDEEPSSSGREEDEDDNLQGKTSKVVFNEADLDSGLGVKMEDPTDDSEVEEVLTVDL